ncbi:MAG: protein kinase [Vicinamibacterales bacterium]
MPITPGTRLGVYDVLAQIGEGGMGQVYRATDTSLGRQVAIKVLPEAVAADADRVARFEREAKTLASLNHPNIAAIYGFEKSGGTLALVMELVEGEDLSALIARKAGVEDGVRRAGPSGPAGLPLDEALPIARQIAEALEAAHEQGIIHRDLKPANIKVRPDGTVKVLDFGLAKALDAGRGFSPAGHAGSHDPAYVPLSQSPTITSPAMLTGVGMILGTAAYMSPEQARGKPVDKRADIWAFGCVLYEMLTGQRAFAGEDVADVLSRVLQLEPSLDALPPSMPVRVRQALRVCLRKDLSQRAHDMADVRLALEGAFEVTAPLPTAAATAPPQRGRLAWMAFVVAMLVAAALAVPALRHLRETPPSLPESRLDIVTPATNDPASFALSPDGRAVVFVATGDGLSRLWLRRLDEESARPLAGTEGAIYAFWSPDGRSIAFCADGFLKRIDVAGGSPRTLAASIGRGGAWSPDGTILFTRVANAPLFRIGASGAEPVAVTRLGVHTSHRYPQFLPDGRRFVFFAEGSPDVEGIYLGSLDSFETTRLAAADSAGVYSSAGWLLFIRAGTLLAQRLDIDRRELTGDPVAVADAVTFDNNISLGAVSASATGLVAYRSGGASQRQLVWFDRAGKALGTLGAPDGDGLSTPALSPDGRRAAVHRTVDGNADIWILETARTTRFTFDEGLERYPVWSRDGDRIVFDSNRRGVRDLYARQANGAGGDQLLVASEQAKSASDWSRDGRFLMFHAADSETVFDLWILPLGGDRKPFLFLETKFDERRGTFSPDGRWVAYMSNQSGQFEIYLRPFRGAASAETDPQWQVSTGGGAQPRWRNDGRELYYVTQDGTLMAVPIGTDDTTPEPGAPVALFRPRIHGSGTDLTAGMPYDVASDGRFLIDTVLDQGTSPITVIQNWSPEAKK